MTPEYRDRVRERLARRIRVLPMPSDRTPTTTEECIAEEAACRHAALVRRAEAMHLTAVPDPGHPGRYITRVRVCRHPWRRLEVNGHCNLTTVDRCTCPEFRVWHRCPCQALVIETVAASDRGRLIERTAA